MSRRRKDELQLFVIALLLYGIYSAAWPLSAGRDFGTYTLYFFDLFSTEPTLPMLMLFRMPLAPIFFGGLLMLGGSVLAEVALGIGYAFTMVAVYIIGAALNRRAGLLSAAAVLAYPPYAALLHTAGSDSLYAIGFICWAAFLCVSARRPSVRVMIWHAACVFALVMIRPLSQLLLLLAVWPWLLPQSLSAKVRQSAVFLVTSGFLLLSWSGYNIWRFDDFTVARGGAIVLPLYRAYVLDGTVRKENGHSSLQLAQAVQEDLLTREPYLTAGVTLDAFFTMGTREMFFDLVGVSDRIWGWQDDYRVLRAAGMEAVRQQPGVYVRGLVRSWGEALLLPYRHEQPPRKALCPAPGTSVQPMSSHLWWLLTTPDQKISAVWSSPDQPQITFRDLKLARRYKEIGDASQRLLDMIPGRSAVGMFGHVFNAMARFYPPMIVWLLLGSLGMLTRWPRLLPATLPAALGLGLVGVTLLGLPHIAQYRLPFDPLFINWGVGGGLVLTARLMQGHT